MRKIRKVQLYMRALQCRVCSAAHGSTVEGACLFWYHHLHVCTYQYLYCDSRHWDRASEGSTLTLAEVPCPSAGAGAISLLYMY